MQFLSIAVALVALGFTLALSKSRKGDDRYGIVLVVLPLALAAPLVGLMASGLQLIYAYRGSASVEGLEQLTFAVVQAAESQRIGLVSLLALLGTLALVAATLGLTPANAAPASGDDEGDEPAAPKPLSRYAVPLMAAAVVVCIAAVATLSEFQSRFIAAPLAFVTAYDAGDVDEFSSTKRRVDEQRRVGSNALVVETFRALVVLVLFLVLFDAFLVGSRSVTFTRASTLLSIGLIVLASAIAARAFLHQRAFALTIEERLRTVAEARAEAREKLGASDESRPTEPPEDADPPTPP